MPETTTANAAEANHHPSIVGNAFMRQYYQLLAKEPQSLHRFYKDESLWSHTTGSHMQEPIAGQKAINDQILKRAYAGARVDLDIGSIDCQASLNGGVFVLVTGVMTLVDCAAPKPFVQTFFLATQPNGYFVLNDCLRFLELPGVGASADNATPATSGPVKANDAVATTKPQAAIGTPVPQSPKAPSAKLSVSPVKTPVKTPVKAASPVKTAAQPAASTKTESPVKTSPAVKTAAAALPLSPVKKSADAPTSNNNTTKASDSPAPKAPATTAASAIASPKASTASPKALSPTAKPTTPAAAPKPVAPVMATPAAPMSWASRLFSAAATSAPAASTGSIATKPTPALASVVGAATSKPVPAAAASPKPANKAVATDASPASNTKSRYHSVFVKDVPAQTKDTDLRDLFKPYGAIAGVNIVSQRGYAYVDFFDSESMRAALAETRAFVLFDKTLSVEERIDRKDQRSGFRSDTSRGGRTGGRGAGRAGRTGGDRKDRDEPKDRRVGGENGSSAGRGSSTGAPRTDRREKSGRRGGKVDGAAGAARAE